jgi:exodeoxyribonuclease VII large subunit
MEGKNYIELLELQNRIKESIADAFPGRYWVKAEIASWSPRANGHCYLTLSQSRTGKSIAEARAMIWKWKYPQLTQFFEEATGQRLQAGLTVLVQVTVSYSELYGVSLFIEDIDPAFTLGEQALERKKAIEKLTAQGYMEMQKELALPDLPYRLAVITSKTAAGYQDFRHHLLDNPEGYAFQLDLFEALVQGEQAPASIMEALEKAGEKNYDAILILRGGGSELDLACFDNYELAVTIATCPVPVVTAIGHDKDVHIADMVAHASVKTPTALADLFLEAYEAQDAILDRLAQRVSAAIQRRMGSLEMPLQKCIARISRGLLQKYADVARLKDNAAHRVQFAAQARVSAEVSKVALKEALIKASDPRSILALGYVLVTGKDNKVLKTVDKVSKGDRIGVRFSDGSLTAKVDEIYTDKIDNNQVKTA